MADAEKDDKHDKHEIIFIHRHDEEEHEHHSSAWKVAHADFMTAMMAFFLVMWLINVTDKDVRKAIANYFNPIDLSESVSDRRGLNDPEDVAPNGTSADGKEMSALKNTTGQGTGAGMDRQGGDSEKAAFQDPYGVLAKLAAQSSDTPQPSSPDVAVGETGMIGTAGGDVSRDPFDPVYWQLAPAKAARSEKKGSAAKTNTAPAGSSLDAAAPSSQPDGDSAVADVQPAADTMAAADPADPGAPPAKTGPAGAKGAKAAAAGAKPTTPGAANPAQAEAGDATSSDTKSSDGKSTGAKSAGGKDGGGTDGDGNSDIASSDKKSAAAKNENKAAAEVDGALKDALAATPAPQIDVRATSAGVLISLTDNIDFSMFPIGSAVPDAKLVRAMEKIAAVLKDRPGLISIHGHTDGRPFQSGNYDNWQLSSARAQMAFYMLTRAGVDEKRIVGIEGHADRELKNTADPNSDENRRIEILLQLPAKKGA